MSSYMQKVGIDLFKQHLDNYAPPDPLYEYYTDAKGKQRRKKRDVPPGISPRDAKILKTVQRRARYLDKSFNICGLRFGWTFIIGIIPGAGDVVCAALNYVLVIRKAEQADLPPWLIGKMVFNNVVSAVGGVVPVVGDIVIAVYKANSRNAMLLEEFLRVRGEGYLKLQAEGDEVTSGRTAASTSGVSRKDMEQVKPGAGMESGRSFSSFLSQRGKKKTAGPDGEQGRFVENMSA
ncbi:hypothetical protein L210DRAFT_3554086 [Boletus edulis BED1]|uniref:PH domain-containing protein n=1 Tax=Boletus edulis BED1 TaxID=1328754 RepID=A0AAD4BLJ4_BOLED|nr:hypothetical protein L210DRAFT_3554086 [Boletus edulis BED1]